MIVLFNHITAVLAIFDCEVNEVGSRSPARCDMAYEDTVVATSHGRV